MFQEETQASPRTMQGGETHNQTITVLQQAASAKYNEIGPEAAELIQRPWDQPVIVGCISIPPLN
jgi:hypothetical protein